MVRILSLDIHPSDLIRESDVIILQDRMTKHQAIVYGREQIERIHKTGIEESVCMLQVELDEETNDLEKLLALVKMLRGKHDYKPPSEQRPRGKD